MYVHVAQSVYSASETHHYDGNPTMHVTNYIERGLFLVYHHCLCVCVCVCV